MQFQARSAGVDQATLGVIRRHLIYEPPERLMRDRLPAADFPPSFAHVHEGCYATAAGVYLGREAVGYREGNHLTHAIVATDPGAYRTARPAQLFGANFWRNEPAATTKSLSTLGGWQPGPMDAAQASQFVRAAPDGTALLATLLAALLDHVRSAAADPPARRVLFISERAEAVVHWLTAATLLIPQHDAVRIGFKVFTSDPARSTVPVVAVHPGWTRSEATVQDDRGYVVFDLRDHRWSVLPESPEAVRWAQLFCEDDPYDVTEAVELAAASGMGRDAGREMAAVAVLRRPPSLAHADEICHWLKHGPPALREAYGGTIVDVLTGLPDLNLVRRIDDIANDQFPARRQAVRFNLLRLELKAALSDPARPRGSAPSRLLPATAKPEAARLVAQTLGRAQPLAFDRVLRVAAQFGVEVPLGSVQQAAAGFVAYWADHPNAGFDPSAWPAEPPVYEMLRDELSVRILEQRDTADLWWNRLWKWKPEKADLASPLDCELLSAAMEKESSSHRLRIVRALLAGRPGMGEDYYRDLTTLLWRRTPPWPAELSELCKSVPTGTTLDAGLFDGIMAAVGDNPTGLLELELCARLSEHRLLALDPATAELLDHHHWLHRFETNPRDPSNAMGAEERLFETPGPLIAAHAEPLARGLLAAGQPAMVGRVAVNGPAALIRELSRRIREGRLPMPDHAFIALSFVVSERAAQLWSKPDRGQKPDPGRQLGLDLQWIVADWLETASKSSRKLVAEDLEAVDSGLRALWETLIPQPRRSRLLWRSRNPDG
jgi:hypothetical protein